VMKQARYSASMTWANKFSTIHDGVVVERREVATAI
jgi:hypothetical protein